MPTGIFLFGYNASAVSVYFTIYGDLYLAKTISYGSLFGVGSEYLPFVGLIGNLIVS